MQAAGVPTARWSAVDDVDAGMAAIEAYPVVLKFDGLAAGKGVVIAADEPAARATLEDFLVARRFGPGQVVVEECLVGEELSLLALCDGERALPMAPAQDYKRIFDGDEGPNTGGMGSYSPVAGVDAGRVAEIAALVHQPIVDLLRERGTPFAGVLYAGIMLTADGPEGPRVQRPLRRPRDAGRAAAPALGRVELLTAAPRARRPRRRRARVRRRLGGDARARERRLPGVDVDGRRHLRPAATSPTGSRSRMPAPRAATTGRS